MAFSRIHNNTHTHAHTHTVQHGTTLSAVAFVAPTIKRINSELYSYVVFSPLSFFSHSAIVLFNSFFFLFLFSQLLLERFVSLFVFVRLSFAAQLSCLCGANKFHILPRATSTIYRDRRLPFPTSPSTHRTRTNSTLAPLCGHRSPQLSGKHDGYINRNYISHDAIIHLFNMLQLIILVT